MLKKIFFIFAIILLINNAFSANRRPSITDYHQTFFPCYTLKNEPRVALRMYYRDNIPYYLTVNPLTFVTETQPAANYKPRQSIDKKPGYFTMKDLSNTPYMQALNKYTSPPYVLENQGIRRAEKAVNGEFITTDLCPSVKPFEGNFFKELVKLSDKNHRPIPIALSITGLWMIGHPEEFNWLIQQTKKNKLDIIWINHSFSHVYYADLPYDQNFLLEFHTNITHEILATEKLLLENNQLPSVFFRLPGLVSNRTLILTLRQFGLIPIGTDAWLAKNQEPKPGSFILVHGNSNEPQGIEKIMPLLKNPDYHWLPLYDAFTIRPSNNQP